MVLAGLFKTQDWDARSHESQSIEGGAALATWSCCNT